MRIGELFAGYGGLGLGVQGAIGGEVRWVSEIDPGASAILAHRLPGVPNIGDATRIDWPIVAQYGPVDVLCGGFPCQDLSAAGARAGLVEGNRSGLWVEFAHAIAALRPKLVIIENVRGMLSARTADSQDVERVGPRGGTRVERTHRAMGRVLRDLADLGFDAEWGVFRASDVGAPHRRERVFIVAAPQDADRSAFDQWRLAASRQAEGGWPRPDAGRPDRAGVDLLGTPRTSDGTMHNLRDPAIILNDRGRLEDQIALLPTPASRDGKGRDLPERDGGAGLPSTVLDLLPTPRATDGTKGGPNQRGSSGDMMLPSAVQLTTASDWGKYAAAVEHWAHWLGRPAPEPTVPGRRGGRRLSPVLVEWMMGLPEGWVTGVPDLSANAMLKALGNGVCPQQATLAIDRLLSHYALG